MDPTDLCFTPATDLAGMIRRKEVSPVEVAAKDVVQTCTALRDESEFAFTLLCDLCAVDYLT